MLVWKVAMQQSEGAAEGKEKEKREHRPTRKAALSMELSKEIQSEQDVTNEAEKEKKESKGKVKSNEQTNTKDKKLVNLDAKEVYEIFRHGAHYLREANKHEVQRTELNRIELSMPKK
jgi:hypothetical protein